MGWKKKSDTIEHSHTYKLGEEEQVRQKKGKNDLSKGLRAGNSVDIRMHVEK